MLQEAITKIQELADLKRRPDQIEVKDHTNRPWLFNAAANVFEPQALCPCLKLTVSNLRSFTDLVFGISGKDPIVIVTKDGGRFLPFNGLADEFGRLYDLQYTRTYTAAWQAFATALRQPMEQVPFVRLLQSLRLNIADYGSLVLAFRKVTFDERTEVVSAPWLNQDPEGTAKRSLSFEMRAKSGQDMVGANLPGGFNITLEVANGLTFTLEVEIDAVLSTAKKPLFSINAPDVERILEAVRNDEVTTLQTKATEKGWTGLVLLND